VASALRTVLPRLHTSALPAFSPWSFRTSERIIECMKRPTNSRWTDSIRQTNGAVVGAVVVTAWFHFVLGVGGLRTDVMAGSLVCTSEP
jgi:hypothetical protein